MANFDNLLISWLWKKNLKKVVCSLAEVRNFFFFKFLFSWFFLVLSFCKLTWLYSAPATNWGYNNNFLWCFSNTCLHLYIHYIDLYLSLSRLTMGVIALGTTAWPDKVVMNDLRKKFIHFLSTITAYQSEHFCHIWW